MFPKWFLGACAENTEGLERWKDTVTWHQFKMNQCLDSHYQYLLRASVFVMMTAKFV